MFPLGNVFIPGDVVSLRIFEERYVQMCRDLLQTQDEMTFCTVMITAGSEVGGNDRRGDVGTVVVIGQMYATAEGGYSVIGTATTRCRIAEWLPDNPYPHAEVVDAVALTCEAEKSSKMCSRMTMISQRVRSLLQQFANQKGFTLEPMPTLTQLAAGQWWVDSASDEVLEKSFWDLVRHVPCGALDRYALLQQDSWEMRMQTLNRIIDHVAEVIAFEAFSPPDEP